MIAAILRAQFLSMRMTARRGTVFSAITWVGWYGIWCLASAAAYFFAANAEHAALVSYLPLALLAICAYWQIVPVLSASMGAGLDMRKLLVYPVPHGKLFQVEVLLRLTTGIEMVMVLVGGCLGLLRNPSAGGWTNLPHILLAVLIFIVFNLFLASGMRSLLERLLTRRKVRELLSFFLLMLYVVPRFLVQTGNRPKNLHGFDGFVQTLALPWTAAAHLAMPAAPAESGLLALLSLCAWTALALLFGRLQFERNLRFDAAAAQSTPVRITSSKAAAWTERFYRLPSAFLSDPLAAIVEKELRSLARSPRFRMVFIMGFTFGVMVWLPVMMGRHAGRTTGTSQYFLVLVCVYAMTLLGQVCYWNCFGFDRSAAVFYFVAPQPISKTLIGKNIASLIYIYLEVLILIAVTEALRLTSSWPTVVETLLVVGVCALYMFALGNISSVNYPRALSPERVSQGGASSRFQGLIFILYPISLVPVFLAYLARYAFESQLIFVMVMAIAAIIGGVLYWLAMESAVNTATRRRESIIQDLSKGEGPVATE